MVRIGWTTESRPTWSANDCSKNEQMMKTKPMIQTPRRMAWVMRLRRIVVSSGASSTPMRWSTLAQRVAKSRCYRKDIDHRLVNNLVVGRYFSRRRRSAGTQVPSAARFCALDAGILCESQVRTGSALYSPRILQNFLLG